MKSKAINRFRGSLIVSIIIVTLSLISVFIPYSLLLGWDLITGVVFWFLLVPLISILTARFYNKVKKQILPGLIGCIIFYLLNVFMIYEHYKTDAFKLMAIGSFVSVLIIILFEFGFTKINRGNR